MKRTLTAVSTAEPSEQASKITKGTCTICDEALDPAIAKVTDTHPKCVRNTLCITGDDENEYTYYRDEHNLAFACRSCEFRETNKERFRLHVISEHLSTTRAPSPVQGNNETREEGRQSRTGNEAHEVSRSGEQDAGRAETPELSETPECKEFLERHGLVIYECLVICVECKSVLDFRKIRSHFMSSHKGLPTSTKMQDEFNRCVLPYHRSLIAEPTRPNEPITRNPYLETRYDYMRCVNCNRCYGSQETYSKHSCLSGDKRGDTIRYNCQRYINNNSSPWFAIKKHVETSFDKRNATPWEVYLNKERTQEQETLDGSQVDEERILHQFLAKEGWLKFIKKSKISRNELMKYAHVERRDPVLMKCGKLVYMFLRRVQESAPHHTLRRMIGLRPAAEHNVTFQRHHFDVSIPTLKKYSRTIVGVLKLVCETKAKGYPFPKHESLSKLTETLFEKLEESESTDFEVDDTSVLEGLELDEFGEPIEDLPNPDDEEEEDEPENEIILSPLETTLLKVLEALYMLKPQNAMDARMNSPIMQYLLISALRPSNAWASTTSITQKIAAATFTGRLVFAYLVYSTSITERIPTHTAFEENYREFLLEQSETPMPNLYLLHRGLSAISSAEQSATVLSSPSLESDAVTLKERDLYFIEIGNMVKTLYGELKSGLAQLLFDSEIHLQPIEGKIRDEPHSVIPSYSFLDDKRNPWMKKPTLLEHIMRTPELRERFSWVDQQGKLRLKTGAMGDWLTEAFELQKKFMIAIILSYGEPARGTELASLIIRNFPGGSIRNVFHIYDIFVLRGSYNKTSFFTGKDKVMARTPPPWLSELFLLFLVYARPLFSHFQRKVRPKMYHNSEYFLFPGLTRQLGTVDISKTLANFTEKYLGIEIPTSLHRQIMGFITSRYRAVFPSGAVSSATDEQFGHSKDVDRKHYGLDASIPGQMDHESLRSSLEVSAIFHRILGLGTDLLQQLSAQQISIRALSDEIEAIRNPSRTFATTGSTALVTADTTRIANMLYHNLAPYLTQHVKDTVEQGNASIIHLFAPDRISSNSTHVLSSAIVTTHASLLRRLRQMFPDSGNAGFKTSQQAQAAQICVDRTRSLVLITPTGSGKTLPALLASKFYDEGRVTVWLLPLRSLREQVRTACIAQGLPVGEFQVNLKAVNSPQNLIVSIEQTLLDEMKNFLDSLCTSNRLARIVLDEAHLVLTHNSFRPVMSTLRWLGQRAIQIVLLTATLPVNLVNHLLESTGLSAPLTLRTTTERPNISINVTVVDSDAEVVSKVVETFKRTGDTRTLIFSRQRREAEMYGASLGIPYVHASMELEEIEEILARFRSGEVRALSCTSFLGVGLDVPDVTHIIHGGLPWDILSYSQEAGRAGRSKDAPPAWSHIIANRNTPATDEGDFGKRAMKECVLDDKQCRRIIPWTFLDGNALPCAMLTPRVHLCDVCYRDSSQELAEKVDIPAPKLNALPKGPEAPILPPLPSASKPTLSIAARVSQAQGPALATLRNSGLYQSIVKFAKYFATRCARCHVAGQPGHCIDHLFSKCTEIDQVEYSSWYTSIRQRQPKNHCFGCGITKTIQY
ncbi:hypothetical protein NMY22_g2295 [Coprinellus aureogranulatus]|nr:hypothetical protein NMY22_g2295 [Coprinellus aureogranulatus]